jgi:hypothetical protein
VSDPALKDGMGGQADPIAVVLRLQELIDLGRGKRRIGSKVAPLQRGPVSGDHRLQHVAPALGGVDVAGAQGAAFEITKLIEPTFPRWASLALTAGADFSKILSTIRAIAGVSNGSGNG